MLDFQVCFWSNSTITNTQFVKKHQHAIFFFFELKGSAIVKPSLKTTTSEQRPPVNNDRYDLTKTLTFIRAPLSSGGHFLQVPRVVVVHRFDCISLHTFGWTFYFKFARIYHSHPANWKI
jgi:hypothetical protein